MFSSWIHFCLALVLAPLLFGVTNRVKAFFAGRQGQPICQLYHDVYKLLHKTPVYSRTTTWIFRASPMIGLAGMVLAAALMPYAGTSAILSFPGDLIFFIYLFGLIRFFTVLAALDTGSSFEGMGSSREVQFSAFAEPALFLSLAALASMTKKFSLTGILTSLDLSSWGQYAPVLALVGFAIFIVFLVENARIPFDDPNTHLELTMVHEAMILDHGAVDLAFILYAAALKFWILGALVVGILLPLDGKYLIAHTALFLAGMLGVAVAVGIVESIMARLRLLKVPHLLLAALSVAMLALIFQARG